MTEESYTDDADVSQLEQRIDELEETIRQMLPSRREAIGMGVAGLAGASLMSGTASAGSAQVGTIGDSSNLVDLVAEDVTITDTLNSASLASAPAGEALLSDGNGNLQFGAAGGVEEVSTFGNLPAIDPPQLAYVVDEDQYYYSKTKIGTPFDITSSEFIFDASIPTQDNLPHDIAFDDTGSTMYELADGSDEIYQYSLSTPFDITTATVGNTTSVSSNPRGIAFNDDGTVLHVISSTTLRQYDLSTAFDVTTKSFQTDISVSQFSVAITWNNDGSKMFICNSNINELEEFDVSSAYDIATASQTATISTNFGRPEGVRFNNTGDIMVLVDANDDVFEQHTLSTPFDITTATFDASVSTQNTAPKGLAFSNDGSRIFDIDLQNSAASAIHQYTVTSGGWEAF